MKDLQTLITEDLIRYPELVERCLQIHRNVTQHPEVEKFYIGGGFIPCEPDMSEADIERTLEAVQYLCGDRARLLRMQFEFVDYAQAIRQPIANEQVALAHKTGMLLHPLTGESLPDWGRFVVPYLVRGNQ